MSFEACNIDGVLETIQSTCRRTFNWLTFRILTISWRSIGGYCRKRNVTFDFLKGGIFFPRIAGYKTKSPFGFELERVHKPKLLQLYYNLYPTLSFIHADAQICLCKRESMKHKGQCVVHNEALLKNPTFIGEGAIWQFPRVVWWTQIHRYLYMTKQ